MRSLYRMMVLPCIVAGLTVSAAANSQGPVPEKPSTRATAQLQLDPAALRALQAGKPVVAELSFDVKRLSSSEPPEGAVRVTLGEGGDSTEAEDRTVGLISLGGEGEDRPLRTQKSLVELNQALKTMDLAQIARSGSIPVTLSIVDVPPEQANVEISNVRIKLRH